MKLEDWQLAEIMSRFGLTFKLVTGFCDTSRGDDDVRFNYMLDERYVLKINSARSMWEDRLQEINRLTGRYREIGVYCPALLPASDGRLSTVWNGFTCFVEEFAKYPTFDMDADNDRREIIEHLGVLAARYSDADLSEIRSMWSIIDLAPLDTDVDEKQENADILVGALRDSGFEELARQTEEFNLRMRSRIMEVFQELPRCVYQGDLNNSNILHDNGRFAGLIDFNMAGTDVNINVFVNETAWFPEDNEFDSMPVSEIIESMENKQASLMEAIFRHYSLNCAEEYAFPCYKGIVRLFQYPNVCAMRKWLSEAERCNKCAELICELMKI